VQHTVTDAVRAEFYAYEMSMGGRLRGRQEAHLERTPSGGTLLRWSTATTIPPGLGLLVRRNLRRQLTEFLTQLQRAAEAHGR